MQEEKSYPIDAETVFEDKINELDVVIPEPEVVVDEAEPTLPDMADVDAEEVYNDRLAELEAEFAAMMASNRMTVTRAETYHAE